MHPRRSRALTTARQLGTALDVPVKELDGLENLDHGLWEGMHSMI